MPTITEIKPKPPYIPDFNPIGHIYTMPDGRRLDSVTQILKAELNLWQFGTCEAAERGTRVHLACQFLDENRLIRKTVLTNDQPYIAAYEKFKAETDYTVLECELRMYHPDYLYAGTIDRTCKINKRRTILDIKTGAEETSYKWQLAGYLGMLIAEDKKKWQKAARVSLHLKPDGNYKLVYHEESNDWIEFLALYSAHNVKKTYGYRKDKIDD